MDGVQSWNASEVLACVRPADRAQMSQLPEVFAGARAKNITVKMENRHIDIVDQKSDSCVARASYQLSVTQPGQTPRIGPMQDEMMLIKESGKWYIQSSQLLTELARQQQQRQGQF
jgi:hypothetical protein